MTKMMVQLENMLASRRGERGAAMAEYGLLLALVALAAVAILATFGDTIFRTFDETNTQLRDGLNNNTGGGTGTGTN